MGALSREPPGLRHSPVIPPVRLPVPFVNEDLVKSRQRKGRKNFVVSVRALRI